MPLIDRTEYKTVAEIAELQNLRIHTVWSRLVKWGIPPAGTIRIPGVVRPSKLFSLAQYLARQEQSSLWAVPVGVQPPIRRSPHLDMTFTSAVNFLYYTKHQPVPIIARLLKTTQVHVQLTLNTMETSQ